MIPLTDLKSRDDAGRWLTENGLTGEGAEIGVYDGANAQQILSTWPGILHLVDPWEAQDTAVYVESPNIDFPAVEKLARERMVQFGKRAVLHKQTSDDAYHATLVLGPADKRRFKFIYIDGNHSSPQVDRDIEKWWTMLKPGGVMGGHDYMVTPEDQAKYWHCRDVKTAVDAFVAQHGLALHLTTADWPVSWWIEKPLASPRESV